MKQCWDANPSERLDIKTLRKKIRELNLFYQSKSNDQPEENNNNLRKNNNTDSFEKYISTSKVHQFENLPELKNATEEELEAFYSKPLDYHIPDNTEDFNKLNSQKSNNLSKINSVFKDIQNDYKSETMQSKVKKNDINFNDEDDIYNNPNLHLEEQNELELPDDIQIL
ncbi:hypothetical protein RclHR1_01650032 [Rhizophagus clarus]|uniref:Serine-threonine/tyrosine-protein kinase catalytic domain-containing protein n=1 Tax=Rhizophagus clarus TaxID=94130 RepID=A0A2Z6QJ72_9GLOM|nr:hypothetical protein RclHR1_01650032 [Rhizophagus clarus]